MNPQSSRLHNALPAAFALGAALLRPGLAVLPPPVGRGGVGGDAAQRARTPVDGHRRVVHRHTPVSASLRRRIAPDPVTPRASVRKDEGSVVTIDPEGSGSRMTIEIARAEDVPGRDLRRPV